MRRRLNNWPIISTINGYAHAWDNEKIKSICSELGRAIVGSFVRILFKCLLPLTITFSKVGNFEG